jgi:hypothetical protein
MQRSALLTICATQASKSSADAVSRKWIVIFAELHFREVSSEFIDIWCRALADIDPELLDRACERAVQTCRFFPTPADIRAAIEEAQSNAHKIEAEAAWNRVFRAASLGGHFDDFDALTQRALGRSGWSYMVHCDSYEGAKWAEKQFVAAYVRLHETRQVEHLLGEGEAKKILRELGAELKRTTPKELPPMAATSAAAVPLAPGGPIRADFAALHDQLKGPAPIPAMTEPELEARRELLRRQSAEILERGRQTA